MSASNRRSPTLAILCAATGKHAEWTERLAASAASTCSSKSRFAASLAEADRMIAAAERTGRLLAINWPLRWVPNHVTAKRLIDEGLIGEVIGVHYYGGNRGPMRHSGRQDRSERGRSGPAEIRKLVLQKERRGRIAARLPRLRRDARHLVSRRPAADRSHERRRWLATVGSRRAQHHRRPLSTRSIEIRDPLGHVHRSLDAPAAAEMRIRRHGHGGHDQQLTTTRRLFACRPPIGRRVLTCRPTGSKRRIEIRSNMCCTA